MELDWFRRAISERYEVKFRGRIGPSESDDKSIRILNRVTTWNVDGISYEADHRHAEIIVKQYRGLGRLRMAAPIFRAILEPI